MPRLSVWMIRGALIYLAMGFLVGALVLVHRAVPLGKWIYQLVPLHAEFLLLGWAAQLALGVAFWILPRFRSGPERGREAPAWLAFLLLNVGVLLVGIGRAAGLLAGAALLGRGAEALAALSFAIHALPRVKSFGAAR